VGTHSLRAGGANLLSLNGYSDREFQKMGRWCSDTFKEYVEGLSQFSAGMSKGTKKTFKFVNVQGRVDADIVERTMDLINTPHDVTAAAA